MIYIVDIKEKNNWYKAHTASRHEHPYLLSDTVYPVLFIRARRL